MFPARKRGHYEHPLRYGVESESVMATKENAIASAEHHARVYQKRIFVFQTKNGQWLFGSCVPDAATKDFLQFDPPVVSAEHSALAVRVHELTEAVRCMPSNLLIKHKYVEVHNLLLDCAAGNKMTTEPFACLWFDGEDCAREAQAISIDKWTKEELLKAFFSLTGDPEHEDLKTWSHRVTATGTVGESFSMIGNNLAQIVVPDSALGDKGYFIVRK